MIIKFYENKKIVHETINGYDITLPFSVSFLTKSYIVFNNVFSESSNIRIELVNKDKTVNCPLLITPKSNNDFNIRFIITNKQIPDYEFILVLEIEDGKEILYNVTYNKDTEKLYVKKKKNKSINRIVPFILAFLIISSIPLFNFFNENVHREYYLLSPSFIGFIATFLIAFLGINLFYLKKIFSKLHTTQNIFNYPEIYFNSNLIKLFGYRLFAFLLIIIFCSQLVFYNYFASYSLPHTENYCYYIDDVLINENKIYYYDIDRVKVYLKETSKLKISDRIQIGKLMYNASSIPFCGNLIITPIFYNFCENCLLRVSTKFSTKEIIEDTININNKAIYAKFKGECSIIKYYNNDSTFCYSDMKLNAGFCENFDSLLSYTYKIHKDTLNSYYEYLSKIEAVNDDIDKKFSLFDTLQKVIIESFHKNYLFYIKERASSYPKNDDIYCIYNNIVNFQNKYDKKKPFYEGGGFSTFSRIINLIILFETSKDQINKNAFKFEMIGNDFLNYVLYCKGINKIEGKILRSYAVLMCYIESPNYQNKYLPLFSKNIKNALNLTRQFDANINKKQNKNYNSQVNLFICYIYEESARFNIPFDNEFQSIFKQYQKTLFESDLKEKLSNIKNTNSKINIENIEKYIDFIRSYP